MNTPDEDDVAILQHSDPEADAELQQAVAEMQQGVAKIQHCKGCSVVLSQLEAALGMQLCDICAEYGPESHEGKYYWPEAVPVKSDTYD